MRRIFCAAIVLLISVVSVAACDSQAPTPATPTPMSSTGPNLEATIEVLQTEVALRATMGVLQTQVAQPDMTWEPGPPTPPPGGTAVGRATPPAQTPRPTDSTAPTPPPAAGGTFYVATSGSDSTGDGSEGKPWATIENALRSVPDGSTILVRPGVYKGRLRLRSFRADVTFASGVTLRSEPYYGAQLRNDEDTVITCYEACQGITLEGFDIAHLDPGGPNRVIVVHVDGQGNGQANRVTFRNNVIHDSYNNDILKINNAANQITVEGNIFYNQQGSDEHIDINSVTDVTVQDNIFFNDFAGSGRTNPKDTSSFIVIKDSNADEDGITGSERVTVRRNIFAHYEGGEGDNFVLVGEDGAPFHEGRNITIENNLMIGNGTDIMRAPFGVKGGRDITFRNNTIIGDFPARAFAMRLNIEGDNPPNENLRFYNNIWADPKGSMGSSGTDTVIRFAEAPDGETASFTLQNNLYWNNGQAIPTSAEDMVNYTADSKRVEGDPRLGDQTGFTPVRWDPATNRFSDGSATQREAFERLVEHYGNPVQGSKAIDAADPSQAPNEDILRNPRPQGSAPDIGAVEARP